MPIHNRKGPGRPRLTDEEAWASAEARLGRNVTEESGGCLVYDGPRQIRLAGNRGSFTPIVIVAHQLGKNINNPRTGFFLTCSRANCISPDHIIEVERTVSGVAACPTCKRTYEVGPTAAPVPAPPVASGKPTPLPPDDVLAEDDTWLAMDPLECIRLVERHNAAYPEDQRRMPLPF